jgi:hypothetical protein
MLPTAIVLEIDRLLSERRWSQRQIARRLAVSRGVVRAIARGERGLHGRDPEEPPASGARPTGFASRCSGCGGMVYYPCRLCAVRAKLHRARCDAKPLTACAYPGKRFP